MYVFFNNALTILWCFGASVENNIYPHRLYLLLMIKVKEKLATAVEDNPKAPFSIAPTLRCREVRYSFLWLLMIITFNFPVFWLLLFYGISTLEGYLMPNPLYTYILDIYDL